MDTQCTLQFEAEILEAWRVAALWLVILTDKAIPLEIPPEIHWITNTPPTDNMQPLIAVPATALLVYRAYLRKSLTPVGIVAAVATATIHAIHPWSVFFVLLVVFFLGGTTVTKVECHLPSRT